MVKRIKGKGWHGDPAGHARAGRIGGKVGGVNIKKRQPKKIPELI